MIKCYSKLFGLFCVTILLCHHVKGQSNKVSPKLDFDDTENKNNSNVPVVVQGRANGNNDNQNMGNGGAVTSSTDGSSGGKSGPKIHGVRVTVDTGDTQHPSKESKESVEITDVGKHKKRVGIHTDITFEITAEADGNATSAQHREDKEEDASVPIFKGTGGSSTHKPRKPYDPKTNWNPNFSAERRSGYDAGSYGRGGGSYYGNYYPAYPHNVPVYTDLGDSRSGGSIYRRGGDGWNSYTPATSGWTTERTHNEAYRPNAVTGYRTPTWKPCYCVSASVDNRRRRASSNAGFGFLQPESSAPQGVNGKLDNAFSRK